MGSVNTDGLGHPRDDERPKPKWAQLLFIKIKYLFELVSYEMLNTSFNIIRLMGI